MNLQAGTRGVGRYLTYGCPTSYQYKGRYRIYRRRNKLKVLFSTVEVCIQHAMHAETRELFPRKFLKK